MSRYKEENTLQPHTSRGEAMVRQCFAKSLAKPNSRFQEKKRIHLWTVDTLAKFSVHMCYDQLYWLMGKWTSSKQATNTS